MINYKKYYLNGNKFTFQFKFSLESVWNNYLYKLSIKQYKKMKAEEICEALGIDQSKILNIYPYGSRVYGTAKEWSDYDYVIVFKSTLPSGAFKDNAISSKNKMIQGTCYSRAGFIDALNNYQISALECFFLPEDKIIQKKMNFSLKPLDKRALVKNIIATASSCWHNAILSHQNDNEEFAKKNVYHAIRILHFGLQILRDGKITNYGRMNDFKGEVYGDKDFHVKTYFNKFLTLSDKLKGLQ